MGRCWQGHRLALLSVLGGALLACMIIALALGAVAISPLDILRMTLNKIAPWDFAATWRSSEEVILFYIRLPRVLGGALVGAALATAGVLFQGLLRNPMADPYIIGTSAGAAFGATVALLLPLSLPLLGFGLVPVAAFLGALGAVLTVYNLARVGGKTPVVTMLLAGFALSSLLVAAMTFLLIVSGKLELKAHAVFSFLVGNISVNHWWQIGIIAPIIIGGVIVARFFAFRLNAFTLGEEGAASLGVEVEKDKFLILALGSLLTAAAVSLAGLVGFVGLVVPHALRLVLGPDHRFLLPSSALAGAAFLVVADLLARTLLAPLEIPVGILTSMVGAPFFIYLLRRTRREYAF